MQIPSFSADTVMVAVIVLAGAYGAVAGKARVRMLVLGIYVGLVLVEQFGAMAARYAPMVGREVVMWVLLVAPIVLFALIQHGLRGSAKGSMLINGSLGLLAGTLLVAAAVRVGPAGLAGGSLLGSLLEVSYLWLLAGLPVVMVVLGLRSGGGHKGH